MAAKPVTAKPARRRPQVSKQDQFTGLTGLWKQWSQFGVVGVVCGLMCYCVMVLVPQLQKEHLASIKEDRKSAYEHGDKAVEKLTTALDKLNDTFANKQATGHINQSAMIEKQGELISLQRETLQCLQSNGMTRAASAPRPFQIEADQKFASPAESAK